MKVCLINSPRVTKSNNIRTKIRGTLPPLGISYLAGYLEKEGVTVDIPDCQTGLRSWAGIELELRRTHYDLYGITGTTSSISNSYRIAGMIKSFHPEARVVMGGVHVTALPDEALSNSAVDFVVRGEGEKALLELDPDIALYNITTPYPGTEMFRWAKEAGFLLSENWDDYDLSEPVMRLPTISVEMLKLKCKEAFRAFYFRPRIILKNVRYGHT